MRLDHLLSRELLATERAVGLYARRPPSMSTGLGRARPLPAPSRVPGRARVPYRDARRAACRTLLSFERPTAGDPGGGAPHRTLKTAQLAKFEVSGITGPALSAGLITVKIVRAHGGCLGTRSR